MGCHPSHWRTHICQDGYCTTNQILIDCSFNGWSFPKIDGLPWPWSKSKWWNHTKMDFLWVNPLLISSYDSCNPNWYKWILVPPQAPIGISYFTCTWLFDIFNLGFEYGNTWNPLIWYNWMMATCFGNPHPNQLQPWIFPLDQTIDGRSHHGSNHVYTQNVTGFLVTGHFAEREHPLWARRVSKPRLVRRVVWIRPGLPCRISRVLPSLVS
jgi:hypothetical protein